MSFLPYLRDIRRGNTTPHAYTWLIWAITQGTAAAAIWYGKGGFGGLGITVGSLFVVAIFFYSLKRGTRDITKSDTIMLLVAVLAIIVWWQLNNPLLAVLMVSAIDLVGYIPSVRKSYHEPWSETLVSWAGFNIGNLFALGALSEYNLLTLTYLGVMFLGNSVIIAVCLARRPKVARPA